MLKKTVSNVVEKLVEHSIHCLPCSYTNDVIDISSLQLRRLTDVKVTSSKRYSTKGLGKTFDDSIVAMVTDL